MFDLLLESSHRDDSNKRSNIGFGQEIMELASIEVNFTHIIWSSDSVCRGDVENMSCPRAIVDNQRILNLQVYVIASSYNGVVHS